MKTLYKRSRSDRELKRLLRENAKAGKPLSIMDDVVFKAMLSADNDDSREALRSLLSACTHRQIKQAHITKNELIPAHKEAKTVRLDVNVTFDDGEAANLEMQMEKSEDNLKDRAAFHTAMLQTSQVSRGRHYDEIKRVYQIFFLNCVLFPGSDKLPRRYSYREEKEHDRLTEMSEIIFYEMPKLEKKNGRNPCRDAGHKRLAGRREMVYIYKISTRQTGTGSDRAALQTGGRDYAGGTCGKINKPRL